MDFCVKILGCSSATPLSNRFPSSQLLNHKNRYFLIDCGEGTQIQLRRLRVKFQRIDHIFISHLHGDHIFGLIGLLSSLSLLGRQKDMTLFCPKGLKEILDVQIKHSQTYLTYPLKYVFLEDSGDILINDKYLSVRKVSLNHRIECWGFIFEEKDLGRKIRQGVLKEHGIPFTEVERLREGEDYVDHLGKVIKNEDLTVKGDAKRTYAYISDNRFKEEQLDSFEGITTMYHEATFLQDLKHKAVKTKHTTTIEAAEMATKVGLKRLIIGHYSSRYQDFQLLKFKEEIEPIFEQIVLAKDGLDIEVV